MVRAGPLPMFVEAKLSQLKELLQKEGFFDRPEQRLLLFTESLWDRARRSRRHGLSARVPNGSSNFSRKGRVKST
jgi:hypothetical protein